MKILTNNEILDFDVCGYSREMHCTCQAGYNKPHVHINTDARLNLNWHKSKFMFPNNKNERSN